MVDGGGKGRAILGVTGAAVLALPGLGMGYEARVGVDPGLAAPLVQSELATAASQPSIGACVDQHVRRSRVDEPGFTGMVRPTTGDTQNGRVKINVASGLGRLSADCNRVVKIQTATYYICTVPTPKKRSVILRSGAHEIYSNGEKEVFKQGRNRLAIGTYVLRQTSMVTSRSLQPYLSGDWVYRIRVKSDGITSTRSQPSGRDLNCGTFTPDDIRS